MRGAERRDRRNRPDDHVAGHIAGRRARVVVSFLVPTGLATGDYWLARRNVAPDVRSRVAIWVSIGIVTACGLGDWLLLYIFLEGGTNVEPLSFVTTLAAVGVATGFVAAVRVTPREIGRSLRGSCAPGFSDSPGWIRSESVVSVAWERLSTPLGSRAVLV